MACLICLCLMTWWFSSCCVVVGGNNWATNLICKFCYPTRRASAPSMRRKKNQSFLMTEMMNAVYSAERNRKGGRVLDACVLQIWHKVKADSHLEETHYLNVSLRGWNWNKIPWCQENICYRSVLSIRYWDGWRLLTFSPNVWKWGGALEEPQGEGEGTERMHVQYLCIKFSENKKLN